MNQFDVVQGFLECAATESPSLERMAAQFLKATQALGFRNFACCSHVDPFHPPADAIMLHNYPRGWVRTYSEEKLYALDPVWKRAESNPFPFFWDTALQSVPLTKPQKTMMADAAGYGITHGYTIPIHLSWVPGSRRASCSVIPDSGHLADRNYIAVEFLASYLYFFASRAWAPRLTAPRLELTRRERQCLSLAAQGKDDWAIGRLLGLSPETVHSYFKRLMQRLGVRTRVQAIIWALESGQIAFGDRPPAGEGPAPDGER
jgi:DNA-binding CsgD family transcriptional regulator